MKLRLTPAPEVIPNTYFFGSFLLSLADTRSLGQAAKNDPVARLVFSSLERRSSEPFYLPNYRLILALDWSQK